MITPTASSSPLHPAPMMLADWSLRAADAAAARAAGRQAADAALTGRRLVEVPVILEVANLAFHPDGSVSLRAATAKGGIGLRIDPERFWLRGGDRLQAALDAFADLDLAGELPEATLAVTGIWIARPRAVTDMALGGRKAFDWDFQVETWQGRIAGHDVSGGRRMASRRSVAAEVGAETSLAA